VRWSRSSFPAILPGGVIDSHPLMQPLTIPVSADIAALEAEVAGRWTKGLPQLHQGSVPVVGIIRSPDDTMADGVRIPTVGEAESFRGHINLRIIPTPRPN
jgi:hypothetical protein